MTTRSNSLLLLFVSCVSISALAMEPNTTNTDRLQLANGNSVNILQANAFVPNYSIAPQLCSELTNDAQYKNDILQAIVNAQISQETVTTVDPVNKLSTTHSKQPILDISKLETVIKSVVLKSETAKLQAQFDNDKQSVIAATQQEEAAKLSIVQRHPKKSIGLALIAGITLPFILPDVLKKAGL